MITVGTTKQQTHRERENVMSNTITAGELLAQLKGTNALIVRQNVHHQALQFFYGRDDNRQTTLSQRFELRPTIEFNWHVGYPQKNFAFLALAPKNATIKFYVEDYSSLRDDISHKTWALQLRVEFKRKNARHYKTFDTLVDLRNEYLDCSDYDKITKL